MNTYILQKDTPCTKAGSEFIEQPDSNYFQNSQGTGYDRKTVENNPEWFKLKEPHFSGMFKGVHYTVTAKKGVDSKLYESIRSAIKSIIDNSESELYNVKQREGFIKNEYPPYADAIAEKIKESKELVLNNNFSINHPDGHHSFSFKEASSICYLGKPDVVIKGIGYIPIQEFLDAVNKQNETEVPNEEEINKAVLFLKNHGYKLTDWRKKYTDEDIRKAFNDAFIFCNALDNGTVQNALDKWLSSRKK